MDAASEIAAHPDFDLSKVGRIEAHIHHLADQVLIYTRPKTELETKFSLEGCLALAPVDNKLSILSFTDPSIARAQIQAIMGQIERRVMPPGKRQPSDSDPATVMMWSSDGHTLEETAGNPMSWEETQTK